MRCPSCGNENPETNRFCGMCAAALTNTAAAAQRPARPAAASPTALPSLAPAASTREEARRPAPVDEGPVIAGPSFLGLNQPAPSKSRGAVAQSALDHLRSSRNLDYLLDDDEPQAKRGFGKVLLLLVALALALGFGYLRWKQGGFDWLTGDAKKSAAAQAGDAPQTPADSAPATATPAPDAMPAATPAAATPNGNADAAVGSAPGATSSAAGAAVLPVSNPAASAPTTDSGSSGNGPAAPSAAAPANSSTATTPPPDAAPADARTPEVDAPPAKPERIAKPTPAKPVDPVASAEKYIYGRGVTQDCDRGLRQLKPAAEQSNPKAMISLGALYSTGVCTPRDLPTAYRWFALALRKQPENSSLQDDLQKLWSQMTPPERQLAIKLSQ